MRRGCWEEVQTRALVLLSNSPCLAPCALLTCLMDSRPHPALPPTPHLSDSPGLWQHRRHTQRCPGVTRVRRGQLAKFDSPTSLPTPKSQSFSGIPSILVCPLLWPVSSQSPSLNLLPPPSLCSPTHRVPAGRKRDRLHVVVGNDLKVRAGDGEGRE